jgi:hypothetical protein
MKKTIAVLTVLLLLVASAVYLVRHQHHVISAEVPPATWNVVIHDRTLNEEAAHLTRPAVADVEAMEQTVLSSRLSGYVAV